MTESAEEIDSGKVKKKSNKFGDAEFSLIADHIDDVYSTRKNDRKDFERAMREIDRQIRMEPDGTHKLDSQGKPDHRKAWMPEVELPLQAQTLEILTADARRMEFPDSGPWFTPHALMTDDYLKRVDFNSLIAGDDNEVPSIINQDNADKLVQGFITHIHSQYDFYAHMDKINAESFKYGIGLGRGRLVKKKIFIETTRGVVPQDQMIPILVPRSIKNVYLDDSKPSLMNEGLMLSPADIAFKVMRYEDLVLAAVKGSNDPYEAEGGWMAKSVAKIEPDDKKNVDVLEWEGDLVVPKRGSGSIYIPNVIVTVVKGKNSTGNAAQRVIRLRFRKYPYSSYIRFPYHVEHMDSPYPTSPLMKGWPIQKAACEALLQLMMAAALNTRPPVSYDKDDIEFKKNGGPNIFPGANWGTLGKIEVHNIIGNPQAMMAIYSGLLGQYADVTGVNAPRLGAQTVSHTTAYAKDVEMNRGTLRTVDYVRNSLKGPLAQWLCFEYEMAKDAISKELTFYIEAYQGWVTIKKDYLPDQAIFDVHGSGGPAEEQEKQMKRIQSLQMALQMDTLNTQRGQPPTVNVPAAQEEVLREGGWVDIDKIVKRTNPYGTAIPSPSGLPPTVPSEQNNPPMPMPGLAQ